MDIARCVDMKEDVCGWLQLLKIQRNTDMVYARWGFAPFPFISLLLPFLSYLLRLSALRSGSYGIHTGFKFSVSSRKPTVIGMPVQNPDVALLGYNYPPSPLCVP